MRKSRDDTCTPRGTRCQKAAIAASAASVPTPMARKFQAPPGQWFVHARARGQGIAYARRYTSQFAPQFEQLIAHLATLLHVS